MAARSKVQAHTWFDFDAGSLPKGLKAKYNAFKEASAAARAAREEFDVGFIQQLEKADKVPEGEYAVVGHAFGKLSYGLVSGSRPMKGERKSNTDSF